MIQYLFPHDHVLSLWLFIPQNFDEQIIIPDLASVLDKPHNSREGGRARQPGLQAIHLQMMIQQESFDLVAEHDNQSVIRLTDCDNIREDRLNFKSQGKETEQ